jgi:hypothetical protein
MRLSLPLLAAAAVLALGTAARGEPITSSEGRFSLESPSVPQLRYQWGDRTQERIWSISFSAEARPIASAAERERRYDLIINSMTARMKGMLRRQDPVRLGDLTGREVVIQVQISDKPQVVRQRLFLTDNRFYQLAYTGPPGTETAPDVEAFFASLRIE